MRRRAVVAAFLAAAAAAGLAPCRAAPLATAYVDPKGGADGPACGARGSECKSLNAALAATDAGGAVVILTAGEFGPIYLTQPVTIVGPADQSAVIQWTAGTAPGCVGGAAGSCGLGTAAYAVEIAGSGTDTYTFRNLTITNAAGTSGAMKAGNAASVVMTGTVLRGGSGTIPQIMLAAPNGGVPFQLFMSNCDLGLSVSGGAILVQPVSNTPTVVHLSRTNVHGAKFGLKLDTTLMAFDGIQAVVDDSEFFSFNGSGIAVVGPTHADQSFNILNLTRTNIANAGAQGLQLNGAFAQAFFNGNYINSNQIGVNVQNTAAGISYGNNEIRNNGNNCVLSGAPTACSSTFATVSGD